MSLYGNTARAMAFVVQVIVFTGGGAFSGERAVAAEVLTPTVVGKSVVVLELIGCLQNPSWIDAQSLISSLSAESKVYGIAPTLKRGAARPAEVPPIGKGSTTIRLTPDRCDNPAKVAADFTPRTMVSQEYSLVGIPKALRPRVLALALADALASWKRSPITKLKVTPKIQPAAAARRQPAPTRSTTALGLSSHSRLTLNNPLALLWGLELRAATSLAVSRLTLSTSGHVLFRSVDTSVGPAKGLWVGGAVGVNVTICDNQMCGVGPRVTAAWVRGRTENAANGASLSGTLWAVGLRAYVRSRAVAGWRLVGGLGVDRTLAGVVVTANNASVVDLNGWMLSPSFGVQREL